jgi:cardiolipin synthase
MLNVTLRMGRVALAMGLVAVIAACGSSRASMPSAAFLRPGDRTAATPAGSKAAGALGALEAEPELRLDQYPTQTIDVPPQPLRAASAATRGNQVKAFVSPAETLPAVLALIDGAKTSVYLETFNFGNDSYGKQLVPRLVAKAKAGVEVKVVMDYVGSRFLKGHAAMIRELRAAGVDVRRYLPRGIRKDDQKIGINIQHRKVYLADGERALVGGVNLMHEFDTIVQDILVEFRGPVVADLYREFGHDFRAAGGKAPTLQPAPGAAGGPASAQVAVTSPGEGRFEARDAIYAGVDGATRSLVIENQYLWDDRLIGKLYAALARGVRVRVMVPGEEAKSVWRHVHAEELKKLVERGAEARIYHGVPADAHLHVKYYSADDRWTAIGSANGDTRAYMDNQELQVAIVDPAFAVNLRQRLFEHDWANRSKPFVYTPGTFVTRPFRSLLEIVDYYF